MPPAGSREAAARDWREIDDGTLRFDRVDAEVAALRALTRTDLVAFLSSHVLNPATRRKLTVRVEGNRAAAAAGPAVPAGEAGEGNGAGGVVGSRLGLEGGGGRLRRPVCVLPASRPMQSRARFRSDWEGCKAPK